jgi:hypothetical protein
MFHNLSIKSTIYSQTCIQRSPLKKWPGKTGNRLFKIVRFILLVLVMICVLLLPEGNYLGEKNGGYFTHNIMKSTVWKWMLILHGEDNHIVKYWTHRGLYVCNHFDLCFSISCLILPLICSIFRLYRGSRFYWWRKAEYQEKTTDLSQVTDKLYHIKYKEDHTMHFQILTTSWNQQSENEC